MKVLIPSPACGGGLGWGFSNISPLTSTELMERAQFFELCNSSIKLKEFKPNEKMI